MQAVMCCNINCKQSRIAISTVCKQSCDTVLMTLLQSLTCASAQQSIKIFDAEKIDVDSFVAKRIYLFIYLDNRHVEDNIAC